MSEPLSPPPVTSASERELPPYVSNGLIGLRLLDIPAAMAYGENPPAGYPAGALRFVVDVLSVQ